MSRKNEIDELFRNALSDKGMNYAPEYWEQMEALIAKRRKKGLKRVAWLGAGVLLFVSVLFLAIPWEMGNEERAFGRSGGAEPSVRVESGERTFGQSGEAEGAENDNIAAKENGVRHTDRIRRSFFSEGGASRSTTDETEPGEIPANRSGERTFGQSGGAEGAGSTVRVGGDDDLSGLEETPRRVEGSIPGISPASLETLLSIPEIPTSPLKAQNLTKNSRRRPSYTQSYLGSYFNYGWVKHRNDASIHNWKNTNEHVQPYIHYGMNIRASKRGFSLSIGTGIRQWTERTRYTREIDQYTFDTSFRLINRNFIKRPDGTYAALVRTQIDTTSHTTSTEFICQDCPVTFRYITVPIAIHYEFGRGKWLGFTEAGMTFSFLSKSSGKYSMEWQQEFGKTPGMRTDRLSGKYLTPMVLQAGLTAGISYRIHPFLSINGHVSYQRSLNSMMNLYQQESDFYGIGVGLEWKLY
ncbi:MAG: hypothetical protein ACYC1Q_11710 [Bacteroidia bacterium]